MEFISISSLQAEMVELGFLEDWLEYMDVKCLKEGGFSISAVSAVSLASALPIVIIVVSFVKEIISNAGMENRPECLFEIIRRLNAKNTILRPT